MSGEYISTDAYIQDKDIFSKGQGAFTSKSLTDLFDVDGDGVIDGVEKDRMQSVGLINTLDSINPLVARAYNDNQFKLTTGSYLTDKKRLDRDKFTAIMSDLLNNNDEIPIERRHDIQPFEQIQTLETDLMKDLVSRRFLEQSELNLDA
jgi:hypothetical protein